MVSVPDTADVVAKRRDVLAALSTPLSKPELVEELDTSRSTVDRAIDSLIEHSFVERTGSRYVATFAGSEALTAYEQFLSRLDALSRAQPVLAELPADVEVDPEILDDAEVVESSMAAPQAPLRAATELGDGATTLYGTGPAVLPHYIEEIGELVEDGDETELVLTEEAVAAFSAEYSDAFEQFAGADNLDIHVTDREIPYIVWIAEKPDETVSGLIVHTDDGVRGVVNNDTDAMNEWAKARYEAFKDDARPLE